MEDHRGVVAAGSKATARAGIEMLRQGGNAVDAVVAAGLATAAGEPALTSLAGGGVLLHYSAQRDEVTICDFSPNAPGLGAPAEHPMEFFPVQLQFGPTTQTFHIGRAAAAVPGALPGLMGALERWGSLPLAEIVAPACRMLRQGVVLDDFQKSCIDLLSQILMHSEGCRRIFAPRGELLELGEPARNQDLADALGRMAEAGWPAFNQEELIPAVVEGFGVETGGCITRTDLETYQPEFRPPLCRTYHGHQLFLPARPAAGGTLIGLSLALLETRDLGRLEWGCTEHLQAKIAAMRIIQQAREIEGDPLQPGIFSVLREEYARLLASGRARPERPAAPAEGATTHISAIDENGDAAAATISHGEGNGYSIGRTGILMNNMMGEADLHPEGFHKWPAGRRLATMMSPTLIRGPEGTLTVMGTGGANRIRTAITQVISNLIDFALDPQSAVDAGRLHWEHGVLNAETFDLPGGKGSLERLNVGGERLACFDRPHLFFGGVHMARREGDGRLSGGGDGRRSGVVLLA